MLAASTARARRRCPVLDADTQKML